MPQEEVIIAPYGSWKSPITADLIVQQTVGLSCPQYDGDDLFYVERRPTEGGRHVIMRRGKDGAISEVLPPPYSARSRVHEYGGTSYIAVEGVVYFVNKDDQRLYKVSPEGEVTNVAHARA